jgi:hypothetical protein
MAKVGYVIYKRCIAGDRRKVEARSHDAPSGGGARDLRFSAKMFGRVIPEVFDQTGVSRGRPVNKAPVYWWEKDERQGPVIVEFFPPYSSRDTEVRLGRVHEVTPFDEHHIPPHEFDPFFFIWRDEQRVWARYVTVEEMRQPGWPPSLVDPILGSVETVRRERNIRGWMNMRTKEGEHRDAR